MTNLSHFKSKNNFSWKIFCHKFSNSQKHTHTHTLASYNSNTNIWLGIPEYFSVEEKFEKGKCVTIFVQKSWIFISSEIITFLPLWHTPRLYANILFLKVHDCLFTVASKNEQKVVEDIVTYSFYEDAWCHSKHRNDKKARRKELFKAI